MSQSPEQEAPEALPTEEEKPVVRRTRASDPTKRERRKPAPVETRRLAHPAVWETAIRLADGRADRIVVESPTRVTITI